MSLTSSMWTGVSGMLAHGDRMSVVGNNISNVNTVGFKASHMHFADFISQDYPTRGNPNAQVGRGVQASAIYGDFSQGSFETTNESTDLAITGNGFFGVSPLGSEDRYYTRAGNFRFDKNGYLKDTNGYVLQGWRLSTSSVQPANTYTRSENSEEATQVSRVGSITNIKLEAGGVAEPQHTNNVTLITQLDKDGSDNTSDPVDPFFALLKTWDATLEDPLGSLQYEYSTTIKVYDEAGSPHTLTVYYDQVSNSDGRNTWEYIVTMNPDEDKRVFGDAIAGTSAAGLLMAGTLTFNSAGQLEALSAYTLQSDANSTAGFKDLDYWRPTAISNNGYPMFAANFSGLSNASWVVNADGTPTQPALSNAAGKLIELNFGLEAAPNTSWVDPLAGAQSSRASDIGDINTGSGLATTLDDIPHYTSSAKRQAAATTSYDSSSSTEYESQDGYTFGYLQNIIVNSEGVIQGRYSNGVTLDLYQVALFDFNNKTGLRREGGNLFSETRDAPLTSSQPAGSSGMGTISSGSLELSNVDLAKEFVDMITTQRGFSANGKVITTTDSMLGEVIMLKR
ncbi:flagellar hook protein FlgE [Megalodesulfovibrio paquesii]